MDYNFSLEPAVFDARLQIATAIIAAFQQLRSNFLIIIFFLQLICSILSSYTVPIE